MNKKNKKYSDNVTTIIKYVTDNSIHTIVAKYKDDYNGNIYITSEGLFF